MVSCFSYQIVDSSSVNNAISDQEVINGIELIEEVDEPIKIPKPKKYYHRNIVIDSSHQQLDTFYGVKNEQTIPSRTYQSTFLEKKDDAEPIAFNPTEKTIATTNWQIIILLVCLLLLGFAKAFSSSRVKQSIKALMNYSVAQEIIREEKVFFHRSNILFTGIHFLIFALFLFQLNDGVDFRFFAIDGFIFYLILVAIISIAYLIKYLFSKVLFFVFDDFSTSSDYIFNVSLHNNLLGILLIPIICVCYFTTLDFRFIIYYLALPIIFFVYGMRIIRLFVIGKSKGISYFYIFLYICTLEILPLVVLYRIFILK